MAKTLSFGAMHVGIAFGLGYAFTGSVATAGVLTVVEPLCNMVAHHFFEGWWERREHARAQPAGGEGATVEEAGVGFVAASSPPSQVMAC